MSTYRRSVGHESESRAVQFLKEKGYTVVTRNWHGHHAEIDIVAMDGPVWVFVEVRYRSDPQVLAEESITGAKLDHLARSIFIYRRDFEIEDQPFRVDTVAVGPSEIRHFQDLFQP